MNRTILAIAVLSATSIEVEAARSTGVKPRSGAIAVQEIISLTNRERKAHGLVPLKIDRSCVSAITAHVNDMARGSFLSHEGRDGRGAYERYRQYNPKARGAGENVAYNSTGTGELFMRQWLNSSGHRSNILNSNYRGIGVAVRANCSDESDGKKCTYYAGQCFSQ